MTKSLKIILFILLIFVVTINISSFVQATEGEEFSEPETHSEEPIEEESIEELPENDDQAAQDALSTFNSSVTNVSNINSYEQANLELNNILSIILIAIGVLLILFAIALLIRISKK